VVFLRRLADLGFRGQVALISGEDERLLSSATDLARLHGLNALASLPKPVTREALETLLAAAGGQTVTAARPHSPVVMAEDIQRGLVESAFEVWYQPKLDLTSLRPVGLEALARWRRPEGLCSPESFIAAAERHGLIAPLSETLLRLAFQGAARLRQAGHRLHLAVNLSAHMLDQVGLPDTLLAAVREAGLIPAEVVLEVTETGLMQDMARALDVLTRLRLMGFMLSIDDFGTGYSSMEQLRRIPFTELKLDRAFVAGAAGNDQSRAILASSVEMARKLGLSTVAEGVETQADLDLVRGLGCGQAQGWLFARPMPLEDLMPWLATRGDAA
jgi:EAL domain-containing protein (putative c-di-GMP-specific phosphodiesterase class I)